MQRGQLGGHLVAENEVGTHIFFAREGSRAGISKGDFSSGTNGLSPPGN